MSKLTTVVKTLAVSLLAGGLMISCPVPFSEIMVRTLHDELPPTITISSPAEESYCANIVEVTGFVSDQSGSDETEGDVISLVYEVSGTSVAGEALIAADGAFSFQFSTTSLGTNFTLKITVVDWNANETEYLLPLRRLSENGVPSLIATASNKEIVLEWDDVPQTESYTLYYTTNGSLPSESNGDRRPNTEFPDPISSPFEFSELQNGYLYTFQLKASPLPGWPESVSDFVRAIPLSEHTLNVRVQSEFEQLTIEWDNISGADTYEVLKALVQEGPYFNVSGPVTGTSFTETDVDTDTWYFYKVRPALPGSTESGPYGARSSPFPPEFPLYRGYADTPDHALDVAVDGDYAYVADEDGGLQIIDISDPSDPRLVGEYVPGAGEVWDVDAEDGYAYLAYDNELIVVDVSNPANPQFSGSCPLGTGADGVDVVGNTAYVACGSVGIIVVNVTDRTNPVTVGDPLDTPGNPYAVVVRDGYAYVADGSYFTIFDLTDLSSPIGWYDTPGNNHALDIRGDYAYIANHTPGLIVIDIIDPAHPGDTFFSNVATSEVCLGVTVRGNYVYAGAFNAGIDIFVFDASSPAPPSLLMTEPFPVSGTQTYGLVVVDDHLYATSYGWGLHVWNVANPVWPSAVGGLSTIGADSVDVQGDYAYVVNWASEMNVVNISDPEHPFLESTYPGTGRVCMAVTVSGNYAYLAQKSTWGYLQIVDVSDPSQPVGAGVCQLPTWAYGVTVAGDYAYVANEWDGGLAVIDISDPQVPVVVALCKTDDLAMGVTVEGQYAYVADSGSGLTIVDISNPRAPLITATVNTENYADGVVVCGNYAYVAGTSGDLDVVNISDPYAPDLRTPLLNLSGSGEHVEVIGNYLFFSAAGDGLLIFDITVPDAPVQIAVHDVTSNTTYETAVSGRYVYLADGNTNGLQIVDLYPE